MFREFDFPGAENLVPILFFQILLPPPCLRAGPGPHDQQQNPPVLPHHHLAPPLLSSRLILLQVRSQLTLSSVSATWAVQNRAALTATLRNTLQLQPEEDLIINSVVAARQLSAGRKLQSGGVKIDFTVGLVNANRASVSESRLRMLASGSSTIVSQFVRQLDVELQARGEVPVALSPASLAFTVPQRISTLPQQAAAPAGNQQSSWVYNNQNQEAPAAAAKPSSDSSTMMVCSRDGLDFS